MPETKQDRKRDKHKKAYETPKCTIHDEKSILAAIGPAIATYGDITGGGI